MVPIQYQEWSEDDTPRTLLIKFEGNREAIDEANKRFEKLRE